MKTWIKVSIVTLVGGVPAFLLGPVLFPPAEGGPTPAPGQIPYFVLLAVWDAVLLGLGVSFLLFGWPAIRRVSYDSSLRAWAIYLSIGFLTVSWWPHLNLLAHNGLNLQGLLYIDYGFQVPLMIAAVVLIYSFVSIARRQTRHEPVYIVVRGPNNDETTPLAEGRAR